MFRSGGLKNAACLCGCGFSAGGVKRMRMHSHEDLSCSFAWFHCVSVVGAVVSVLWLRERLGSLTGEGFLDVVPFVHVGSERYVQLFA